MRRRRLRIIDRQGR